MSIACVFAIGYLIRTPRRTHWLYYYRDPRIIAAMSLLHRWSLPSRGLVRDKPQDDESSGQSKFPTIHIGQAVPRRRTNLSSAFSTLFEKPENRRRTRKSENRSEATDCSPLLTPRRCDLRLDVSPKFSLACKSQDAPEPQTSSLKRDGKPELPTRRSRIKTDEVQHCPDSESPSRTIRVVSETPKVRSFSLSSTETNEAVDRDEPLLMPKTNQDCVRVRSASSSYPSEGMRSPASGPCSPKLTAATTMKDIFVEYRRYGRYPSRTSWFPSSAPISKASVADVPTGGNIHPATTTTTAQDGAVLEREAAAGQPSNFELSPFADPPESQEDSTSSDTRSRCGSSVIHGEDQQRKPSSTSRFTPSISGFENVIYYPLEVISQEGEGPGAQSMFRQDRDAQLEGVNVGSMKHLRASTDTDSTMSTTVRRSSVSDSDDDSWSTIPDSGEKPSVSRRSSWTQLFALATSNGSSTTFVQRIRRLKLRIWAKRVMFKTKARLKLVGRPVPTKIRRAASLGKRRASWRPKLGKKAKRAAAKKEANTDDNLSLKKENKKENKKRTKRGGRWHAAKTLGIAKKRARQHKMAADRIFDTLSKRASLQLRLPGSVKPSRKLTRHRRVESSCPSDV